MSQPAPHIELRQISKSFGATVALDSVDLTIERGSVHALVGENGAGKSTLGKIIAGMHGPDSGQMAVSGRSVEYRSPRQALEDGLTIVAQELSLMDPRSVLQNVYLGTEDRRGPFLNSRATRRRFRQLTEASGIEVPPNARTGDLSVAQQQKVEILRALARNAELIVMDEPTARLSSEESLQLRALIRRLASSGTTVVLVSHFLEEVLDVADVVTILRDGKVVRSAQASDETTDSLVEAMIGRTLAESFPAKPELNASAPFVLEVQGLGRDGAFEDISLSVRAGEIVVVTGLVGAGRTELVRSIFGADPHDRGRIALAGKPFRPKHPREAIEAGIAFIPESRKTQGLFTRKSVTNNITLPYLSELSRLGLIDRRREVKSSLKAADAAGVKAANMAAPVTSLSGGNQQKVMFAKALYASPRLLIADEPTRGVDVGSKSAIYQLIADLAADGMGVLIVSSEIEEVMGLAHRVVVLKAGKLVTQLSGQDISEERIINAAFGRVSGGES
jgi:rhamnose transport system ATP-binding protein